MGRPDWGKHEPGMVSTQSPQVPPPLSPQPPWLLHLPRIIEELRLLDVPVLDRAASTTRSDRRRGWSGLTPAHYARPLMADGSTVTVGL